MGIWDAITDLVETVSPFSVAEAEAPTDPPADDSSQEEEEEEEEEEISDPKETFEEECKESHACAKDKHHFDECVERVTAAQESGEGTKEDCVEEFFHLAHCASQCAAPKLWSVLK